MKVLFVAGTRPEVIKLAPVYLKMKSLPLLSIKLCVTGQHRELLDQMLQVFDLEPDVDLNLMSPNQGLNQLCSGVLLQMDDVFDQYQPDWVIVQGDTLTAMTAALAAFHRHIKIAHVEAGLRSFNFDHPWPEEANRQLISRLASLHFTPTDRATSHLKREGVESDNIIQTGNTVIDALSLIEQKLEKEVAFREKLDRQFSYLDPQKKMILVTGHRRENLGQGHGRVFDALAQLADRQDVQIVFPVHLNPNIKGVAHQQLGQLDDVFLIEPACYLTMVYLLRRCYLVITDSGGIQEEAPRFGKPVLVTRFTTERQEGIDAGAAKLVGTDTALIHREASMLLDNVKYYDEHNSVINLYGDGKAAHIIAEVFESMVHSNVEISGGEPAC